MTDPQLPPSGAVPPVPPAPSGEPQPATAFPTPPPPYTAPAQAYPPVPPAAYPAAPPAAPAQVQAAPPGAYQVPVGGYAAPAGAYAVPATSQRQSGFLGVLALILALVAAVVAPIIAGAAGFEIGARIPDGLTDTDPNDPDFLALLSPARDQVLWAEIAFWAGTLAGIAAIVVGILAIRRRQRRGLGIAALVLAGLGPILYTVVLTVTFGAGAASGFLP